jgi:hypothetical protein
MGCVGVVLGLHRIFVLVHWPGSESARLALDLVDGIFVGTQLSGFLLALGRTRKGHDYPQHPGEYLWLADGIGAAVPVFVFALGALVVLLGGELATPVPRGEGLRVAVAWLAMAQFARTFACISLAVLVPTARWKTMFIVVTALGLLRCCVGVQAYDLRAHPSLWVCGGWVAIVDALWVALLAIYDHTIGMRYPWTHWVGATTHVGSNLVPAGVSTALVIMEV